MNLFSLVLKQMRQRALGTWLTLLSVTLGVALAIAILVLWRESDHLFGQTSYGYDLIVGQKGSDVQLVMNTVYHVGVSQGNIPYEVYESMLDPERNLPPGQRHKARSIFGGMGRPTSEPTTAPINFFTSVRIAVPIEVGDTYRGDVYGGKYPIIGTTTNLFGVDDETGKPLDTDHTLPYRPETPDEDAAYYEFADGHVFAHNRFEAVIGSDVAAKTDLKMGSEFQATHGIPKPGVAPDIHPEKWVVVGVLKPTHTAADSGVYIPIKSCWTIGEHDKGMKAQWILNHTGQKVPEGADADDIHAYGINPDGTFDLYVPKELWEISAILVKSRMSPMELQYAVNNRHDAMAVIPAQVMRQFFDTFLKPSTLVLLVIAIMVSVVAGVGVLVSIYNSVSARMREIAVMRALGATRARVLTLICVEAGLIGLFGSVVGLLIGHVLTAFGSALFARNLGTGIRWGFVDKYELLYVVAVIALAVLAGLIPGVKAYRTPVATNLLAV